MLGLGLGAILRNTAGAIATLVAIVLIAPILANFLPSSWQNDVSRYLPSNALGSLVSVGHRDSGTLSPTWAVVLLLGYAVVSLVVAAVLLRRRDA